MDPHPAYEGEDMPGRKLQEYVKKGIASGAGIEPVAIAKALFTVASRGENVPLYLPLGATAPMLIKQKLEKRLANLETVKDLTAICK